MAVTSVVRSDQGNIALTFDVPFEVAERRLIRDYHSAKSLEAKQEALDNFAELIFLSEASEIGQEFLRGLLTSDSEPREIADSVIDLFFRRSALQDIITANDAKVLAKKFPENYTAVRLLERLLETRDDLFPALKDVCVDLILIGRRSAVEALLRNLTREDVLTSLTSLIEVEPRKINPDGIEAICYGLLKVNATNSELGSAKIREIRQALLVAKSDDVTPTSMRKWLGQNAVEEIQTSIVVCTGQPLPKSEINQQVLEYAQCLAHSKGYREDVLNIIAASFDAAATRIEERQDILDVWAPAFLAQGAVGSRMLKKMIEQNYAGDLGRLVQRKAPYLWVGSPNTDPADAARFLSSFLNNREDPKMIWGSLPISLMLPFFCRLDSKDREIPAVAALVKEAFLSFEKNPGVYAWSIDKYASTLQFAPTYISILVDLTRELISDNQAVDAKIRAAGIISRGRTKTRLTEEFCDKVGSLLLVLKRLDTLGHSGKLLLGVSETDLQLYREAKKELARFDLRGPLRSLDFTEVRKICGN